MSRFRDFDAARAERAREPIEFKLGGEMFSATGDMPAGLLLDAAAGLGSDDPAAQGAVFAALFEGIVAPEDHERFGAAVRRVDIETVMELITWIMEEVTGRPLPMSSPSPFPRAQDGVSWRVDSSSPASTPSN
jgi:hypothetical protein